MQNSPQNQSTNLTMRIELLTEGIEELVRSLVHQINLPAQPRKSQVEAANQMIVDARADLAICLREFMQPMLRVLSGIPQSYVDGTEPGDMPTCTSCLCKSPCKVNCAHWAAAIRRMRQEQGVTG